MRLKLLVFTFVLLIKLEEGSGCNEEVHATKEWNSIQSPNFPKRFPPQVQCSWKIVAPASNRIKLQFTQFTLVRRDPNGICSLQWVVVMDGDNTSEADGVQACGSKPPGTFVSSGNVFRISLRSNAPRERFDYRGFEVTFALTDDQPVMPDFEFASLFGLRCVNENSGFEDAAINMMSTGRNFDRLGWNEKKKQENLPRKLSRFRNDPYVEDSVPLPTTTINVEGEFEKESDLSNESHSETSLSNGMMIFIITIGILVPAFVILLIFEKRKHFCRISEKRNKKITAETTPKSMPKTEDSKEGLATVCHEKNSNEEKSVNSQHKLKNYLTEEEECKRRIGKETIVEQNEIKTNSPKGTTRKNEQNIREKRNCNNKKYGEDRYKNNRRTYNQHKKENCDNKRFKEHRNYDNTKNHKHCKEHHIKDSDHQQQKRSAHRNYNRQPNHSERNRYY